MGAIRKAASTRSPRSTSANASTLRSGRIADLVRGAGGVAVMGILNVTPDSFSDGGRHASLRAAVRRAREMEGEGAHVIDVGGESTRPGASPVPLEEERRRVLPVVRALREAVGVPLSIDTSKADVAEACLEAGASIVNDVSAGRDDRRMLPLVAAARAGVILMHRRGSPRTMQRQPRYRDVVAEVATFLEARAARARALGIPGGSIALDPGIGFGKTLDHNLSLLARLDRIAALGYVVVGGASRKSFLGRLLDGRDAGGRLEGSIAAALAAVAGGARIVRVHDVGPTVRALRVADAIRRAT